MLINADELGVPTPDGGGQAPQGGDPAPNEGQNSNGEAGTGGGAPTPNNQEGGTPEGGQGGQPEGGKEGGEPAQGDQPTDSTKRVNDLMSKWQSEEAAHNQTKSELQRYQEQFGELPQEGKPNVTSQPSTGQQQTPQQQDDPNLPAALKEGWVPKDMNDLQQGLREIAQYSANQAKQSIEEKQQAEQQAKEEAKKQVGDFVSEVKSADPQFDEKQFFEYANKYGFPLTSVQDLRSVYRAYVDHQRAVEKAAQQGADNKNQRRENVHKPGSGGGEGQGVPYSKIRGAHSVTDLVHDQLNG